MTSQIFLQSEFQQPDVLRLDVLANHLPQNFLGIAFDLVVPGVWTFDRDELCGGFASVGAGVVHLVSARAQEHRVVFGLARTGRGGGVLDLQVGAPPGAVGLSQGLAHTDECVARFYLRFAEIPAKGEVMFERAALSTYLNGRRDVADVQWRGSSAVFPGKQILAGAEFPPDGQRGFPGFGAAAGGQIGPPGGFTQVSAVGTVGSIAKADLLRGIDPGLAGVYESIFGFLLVVLAGFGLCVLYYRLRNQR